MTTKSWNLRSCMEVVYLQNTSRHKNGCDNNLVRCSVKDHDTVRKCCYPVLYIYVLRLQHVSTAHLPYRRHFKAVLCYLWAELKAYSDMTEGIWETCLVWRHFTARTNDRVRAFSSMLWSALQWVLKVSKLHFDLDKKSFTQYIRKYFSQKA